MLPAAPQRCWKTTPQIRRVWPLQAKTGIQFSGLLKFRHLLERQEGRCRDARRLAQLAIATIEGALIQAPSNPARGPILRIGPKKLPF